MSASSNSYTVDLQTQPRRLWTTVEVSGFRDVYEGSSVDARCQTTESDGAKSENPDQNNRPRFGLYG